MSTAVAVKPKAANPVAKFRDELTARESMFRAVLPPHVSVEKFKTAVLAAVASKPDLLNSDVSRRSLFKACVEAAELGLSLNPVMAEADILPSYDKRLGGKVAQFRPRYMGLMKLARKSGEVLKIEAHTVRVGDVFDYEFGLDPKLTHKHGKTRGALQHVYCVWKLANGEKQFEVMDREQVLAIRERSQAKSGPWATDEEEMWRKTVVRRASKYMPRSAEDFARAVAIDNLREVGEDEPPGLMGSAADAIDILGDDDGEVVSPPPPPAQDDAGDKKKRPKPVVVPGTPTASPQAGSRLDEIEAGIKQEIERDWSAWADGVRERLGALETVADLTAYRGEITADLGNYSFLNGEDAMNLTRALAKRIKEAVA